MVADHAIRPAATRGPGLPASIAPALLDRLTSQVSAAPDAARVTTNAPYTGAPLADLPVSTPDDVEAAFARARAAQKAWAATPIAERKKILLRYHDLVLARQEEALDLMQAENGKTRRDAFLEVVDIGIVSRYYARNAAKYLEPKRRRGAIPLLTHTTELRHPKGVVTVISPWNYPLSMAASDAIAALMAGNAVVQKPDTQTALTALWSMDLMYEAGLPADVWQMVVGRGSSIGGALMDNADYMMFTGSTATGRQIASDEAIARANATPYGLNGSVWTRDGARGRAVAARVHAGTVNVNEAFAAAWGSIDAPMGGMGDSGLGRRHGAEGILKYTEPQTVAHQRLQGFHPPARISPDAWAGLLSRALKVMKAAGVR
ncbi:aldehyde dehydrogenase family protein [Streptomyces sp. NPDC058739]|uniref:aldehyde dehydrogenase family protein n=1 Tax=Streptomyces sp. NPDC058739 TaxID=3346618 RepID=UPI0036BAC847